ncbi:MAG: hypothetical protein ABJA71_17350 [Ginsengibacter sp.]
MRMTKFNSLLVKSIFTFFLFINATASFSQVSGCKDPMANNYNSAATINDGSCTYNVTSYTPPVLVSPISVILHETSGLQMAGNFLWTLNDSRNAPAIYRIDTLSDAILQTVNLSATNVDWEDMAFDGTYFYIGDFGNNTDGGRTDFKIYKFPLSAIPDYVTNPTVTVPAGQIEIINYSYSDQPQPVVATTANNTKFDCEAMVVDAGQIHLFTKNWIDVNTTHYVINGVAAGTYVATPLETLATSYLVSGAAKAPGKNIIALVGYQHSGLGNHYMHLLTDYSGGKYFNGNKRRIDLPNAPVMGQADGICFRRDTYGYISNEKFLIIDQALRSFSIADFIPLYVLPLTLKNFNVINTNGTHKITWDFDDAVQNVQLQYSTNGLNFTVLKTYTSSVTGIFYNKAMSPFNYYRITWKENNGAIQYSNIISIRNEQKNAIGNFSINANGQLSFVLSGSSSGYYTFKLASTDGRILSQVKERAYMPGSNKIYVSKKPVLSSIVYLIAANNRQRTTTVLHVEK